MISSRTISHPDELTHYKHKSQSVVRLDVTHPKRLYGREEELKTLTELVKGTALPGAPSRLCLVHGLSGVGKSALCKSACSQAAGATIVLQGKFDQFHGSTTTPYSAIIDAFDQLGGELNNNGHEERLKKALDYEANILAKFIPSFSRYANVGVAGDSPETSSTSAAVNIDTTNSLVLATERLVVAFSSFLKSFCSASSPLVLFLDDLQWCDRYSSVLLTAILNDCNLYNFTLIGGFRDDDPALVEPFLDMLSLNAAQTTDMLVSNLDLNSVNDLLAGLLLTEQEQTLTLAEVLHRKTHGNPYFVLQQLEHLHGEHLLTYNFATLRWDWDMTAVSAGTELSDNVVDVVKSRLGQLPWRLHRILRVAACLGYFVDPSILESLDMILDLEDQNENDGSPKRPAFPGSSQPSSSEIIAEKESESQRDLQKMVHREIFEAAIKQAEEEAFLERTGSVIRFSHDRIQQCVYELIQLGQTRDLLHYRIGQHLKKKHEETSESRFLLLAVDQLNRSSLTKTAEERLSLAKLNYEASLIAKQQAGIESVASFLRKAIELVEPSFWQFHYSFVLDIYNSSAEVESSLGRHEVSDKMIEVIMQNAVRDVDKVRARVVRFQTYGVQRQFDQAIKEGRSILKLLGEPLPSVSLINIMIEYFKAKRATRNKSDAFFKELAPTTSTDVKTILKILMVSSVYGWNADPNYAGLVFLRAMRVMVREGSSEATPYLYSGYGFMLALFGDPKGGFRFGQLALSKDRGRQVFPSSLSLSYQCLTHLQLPLSIGLDPFLSGYRIGLETGDLFFGTIDLANYAVLYIVCGLPLRTFANDMANFGRQLAICHQELPLAFIMPAFQLALNLLGKTDDPLDLSRDAIKRCQEFIPETMLESEDDASFLFLLYLQAFNAFILCDVDIVERSLNRISTLKERRFGGTHSFNYLCAAVDGLAGMYICEEKPKSSRMGKRLTNKAMAELRKLSNVNSLNLLSLLEANKAASRKNAGIGEIKRMYDVPIAKFARSGQIHYGAIANELVGKFMLRSKDEYWAKHYLSEAQRLYREYDAVVKVKQMVAQYSFLDRDEESSSSVGEGLLGKAKFNTTMDIVGTDPSSSGSKRSIFAGNLSNELSKELSNEFQSSATS